MKVLVQLHDGREIVFEGDSIDSMDLVRELKAQGIKLADIKNTIHVIPRKWRGVHGVSGGDSAGH